MSERPPAVIHLGSRLLSGTPRTTCDQILAVRAAGVRVVPATLAPEPFLAEIAAELGGLVDLSAKTSRATERERSALAALDDLGMPGLTRSSRLAGTAARLAAALAELIRATGAKHVHAQAPDGALSVALIGARLEGVSVGVTVPPSFAHRLPDSLGGLPELSAVLPTGPAAYEALRSRSAAPAAVLTEVPVGVSPQPEISGAQSASQPLRLLCIGAPGVRGSLPRILQAFAQAGIPVEARRSPADAGPRAIAWCDIALVEGGGPDLIPDAVRALAAGRRVVGLVTGETLDLLVATNGSGVAVRSVEDAAEALVAATEQSQYIPDVVPIAVGRHSLERTTAEFVAALPLHPRPSDRTRGRPALTSASTPPSAIGGPLPVSVVIPAYNRESLLPRALASVASQRPRPPAEVIVVDDGSSDGTIGVAAALGARVIEHEVNRGAAEARNSGVAAASHDWVAFLDSDDEWLPHHLATLWPRRWGHVIVAGASLVHGTRGREVPVSHRHLAERAATIRTPAPLLRRNILPASGNLVSRRVMLEVGGYDPSLGFAEDFDLWIRLIERGTGYVTPIPVSRYHRHEGQKSKAEGPRRTQRRIAYSYADRDWWSPGLVERRDANAAYAEFAAAVRRRDLAIAAKQAAKLIRAPRLALAAAQERIQRLLWLRRCSGVAPDGLCSIALLPRAVPRIDPGAVAPPARKGNPAGRLTWPIDLARRPPAYAIARTPAQRTVLKLLGIRVIPARAE